MGVTINKKTTKAAVQSNTTVKHSKTGAHVVKEKIESMAEVPSVHANVGVTASRTINLGEYNNVKVGVSIHHPCAPDEASINETYEWCIEWVNGKMEGLLSDINTDEGEGDEGDGDEG